MKALKRATVNLRISPLGACLFLIFLDGGLFKGGGAYKVIVDIKGSLSPIVFNCIFMGLKFTHR